MPKTIARREVLAGLGALPLVSCLKDYVPDNIPSVEVPEGPGLDALARKSGRRFGSAVAWNAKGKGMSVSNPAYAAILNAECGVIVPENEMKWQTLRPSPDSYDFTAMDKIAAWAATNGQELRAHVLLWHRPEWFPDWLNSYDFGARPASEAERLLSEHIDTVAARYGSQIKSWDVVNEAIDHSARAPIETSLSRAMGSPEAVIDLAFHKAREALPNARLVYNDYMSWEPSHAHHCEDVLRLLEGMRARGVPCDTLGIQSHIEMFELDPETGVGVYDEAGWRRFLDEVTGMGYRLLITEFDVKDKALPAPIAQRDAKVAEYAQHYLELMLDYNEHLDDILVWGMVDAYNWLQYFDPASRADGLEVRGAPYDSSYRPKPLREAIATVLADVSQVP
ncbi:endo-1,4-beta-xylanase [Erythrobacter sp. THAF29]|uniref:endo-1,4-beta-xylanase n=1 Tax=Erythrobacter sp. THAF29 TaxID=2587851 RepID=UPI001268F399|nr:endo-1,4-beta-xylanase [Erythrobacter sp. THAF29]QFT78712.1 Exoglucanase/xylanase precursor [Erythrobacter sp. THAF29]